MKIIFTLLLISLGSTSSLFPQEIKNINYHGYIMQTDKFIIQEFRGKNYKQFQLTPKDIETAEKILKEYMMINNKSIYNKLGKYIRQYIGLESQGHKIVFINLLMNDSRLDEKRLTNGLFFIEDGGDNYFNIKIDITTNYCFDIFINGEA